MDSNIAVFSFFIICGIMSCCMALSEPHNDSSEKKLIPICVKYQALHKVRSKFMEDTEYFFELEHTFPDKDKMLEDLKNNASAHTEMITQDCLIKIKNSLNSIYAHTVKWLHFLAFSDGPLANRLRNMLLEKKVEVFGFCSLVGKIFNDVSNIVFYGPVPKLSPEIVLEGLEYFGIKEHATLESVKILVEIGNMSTVQREGNITTMQSDN